MRNGFVIGFSALFATLIVSSAQAAAVLAVKAVSPDSGTVVISDGVTPNGNSVTTAGDTGTIGAQVFQVQLGDGTQIADFVLDMRVDGPPSLQRQDVRSGGTGYGVYLPATGSNDYQASGTYGGFQNSYVLSVIADMTNTLEQPINGWVADDGVDLEEINWLMIRPDDVARTTGAGVNAVALGFRWFDVGTVGIMDAADTVGLYYAVYSDTDDFSDIDTVVKLDSAVGNIPEPSSMSLILPALALLLRKSH